MNTFKKGSHVKMSPEGIKQFPGAVQTGVVTSLLGGGTIRIRRTGLKSVETWHGSFWRPTVGKGEAK